MLCKSSDKGGQRTLKFFLNQFVDFTRLCFIFKMCIRDRANIDNLSLASNGGNLIFDNLEVGNTICLDSKNGDIRGTIIGSYDEYSISCNIKKGESNLPPCKEDGAKNLTVSNNNGNIEIKFTGE